MTLKTIASLSIPVLLLACGGAEGSALTQPSEPNRPSPPAATTPGSSSSAADAPSLEASQLLQAQVASAALTLDDATDIALAANPGSQVQEADLEGRDATLRYEVELRLADGSVLEVHVDANSGDIIASFAEDDDGDDDDDVAVDCTGAISAVEAQAIAEAEAGGSAVEVEIDDGCEFEVTVDTGAGFVEVDVAPDGTVQKVENDDDGPGDDDDDDDDGPDDDDDDDDDGPGDDDDDGDDD